MTVRTNFSSSSGPGFMKVTPTAISCAWNRAAKYPDTVGTPPQEYMPGYSHHFTTRIAEHRVTHAVEKGFRFNGRGLHCLQRVQIHRPPSTVDRQASSSTWWRIIGNDLARSYASARHSRREKWRSDPTATWAGTACGSRSRRLDSGGWPASATGCYSHSSSRLRIAKLGR